jgi:hypothetical protein
VLLRVLLSTRQEIQQASWLHYATPQALWLMPHHATRQPSSSLPVPQKAPN